MTSDYCANKTLIAGSNLYYATLFEHKKNKSIIIGLHALLHELTNIIQTCSDPGIARIKLKWWQEELDRLFSQRAQHPVTREISSHIVLDDAHRASFNKIIVHFESLLFIEQARSLESGLMIFRNTSGELWRQVALLLGCHEKTTLNLICEIGALYHFLICLQQPHTCLNETRCIIPVTYITPTELSALKMDRANRKSLQTRHFAPLFLELETRLNASYTALSNDNPLYVRHVLILTRLAAKTCVMIAKDGAQLLEKRISLTPLNKLWIAWRVPTAI